MLKSVLTLCKKYLSITPLRSFSFLPYPVQGHSSKLYYAFTLIFFFAIDLTWLGFIAKNLYREKLGFILSDNVNWAAAIFFYLIYIAGIVYFAVLPAHESGSLVQAIINGAALGFLCYATYDLTNMATIDRWPLSIVTIDILWGTTLTACCAAGGYWAGRFFAG